MVIYSIEGNIGSGKSTFLAQLKKEYSERFVFVPEPVDEWKTIVDPETGKNKIELFYGDMKTHAFSFQMMAYISRLSYIKQTIRENHGKHLIVERSLYTDKNVFAKMLHEDGLISPTDYQIYTRWFEHFIQDLPEIKYIYIQTAPTVALDRIRIRNRSGEEGINLEYIQRCHQMHEQWLLPYANTDRMLVIDGNVERKTDAEYGDILRQTTEFCTTPIDELVNTMKGYFK
jgi:deoxyadenosine/deoxycytidine kinase